MFQVTKKMCAALFVVAAIAAPAASARPIDPIRPLDAVHGVSGTASPAKNSSLTATRVAGSRSDGFDWGDAGVGGAAVFALLGLGTGALVVARRNRDERAAATS